MLDGFNAKKKKIQVTFVTIEKSRRYIHSSHKNKKKIKKKERENSSHAHARKRAELSV